MNVSGKPVEPNEVAEMENNVSDEGDIISQALRYAYCAPSTEAMYPLPSGCPMPSATSVHPSPHPPPPPPQSHPYFVLQAPPSNFLKRLNDAQFSDCVSKYMRFPNVNPDTAASVATAAAHAAAIASTSTAANNSVPNGIDNDSTNRRRRRRRRRMTTQNS